jgi:hypothetical protein
VPFLQAVDVCRDRDAASFDAAMIGVDRRSGLGQWMVEEHRDNGVQRALIAVPCTLRMSGN